MANTLHLRGNNLTIRALGEIARGKLRIKVAREEEISLRKKWKQVIGQKRIRTPRGQAESIKETSGNIQRIKSTLYSYAVSSGNPLDKKRVRAIIACKINDLIKGQEPISPHTLKMLTEIINRDVTPLVRENSSISSEGFASTLAEIALLVIGDGEAIYRGELLPGALSLKRAQVEPVEINPVEVRSLLSHETLLAGDLALVSHSAQEIIKNIFCAISLGFEFAGEKGKSGKKTIRQKGTLKITISLLKKLVSKKNGSPHGDIIIPDKVAPSLASLESNYRRLSLVIGKIESEINKKGHTRRQTWKTLKNSNHLIEELIDILSNSVDITSTLTRILSEEIEKEKISIEPFKEYYNEKLFQQMVSTISGLRAKTELITRTTKRSGIETSVDYLSQNSIIQSLFKLIPINNSILAIFYLFAFLKRNLMRKKNLGTGNGTIYRKLKTTFEEFDHKRPISHLIADIEETIKNDILIQAVEAKKLFIEQ